MEEQFLIKNKSSKKGACHPERSEGSLCHPEERTEGRIPCNKQPDSEILRDFLPHNDRRDQPP